MSDMSDDTVKTTYKGIVISYDESRNRWVFELWGKERSSESLTNAKEAIDKPPSREKAERFEPIDAWLYDWHEFKRCRVTSMAESHRSDSTYYWITTEGRRSKRRGHDIIKDTPGNGALMEAINAKDAELRKLMEEKQALLNNLDTLL